MAYELRATRFTFSPGTRGNNSDYVRTANQNGLNAENYKVLEFFLLLSFPLLSDLLLELAETLVTRLLMLQNRMKFV